MGGANRVLSMHRSRANVEPMVGLAARPWPVSAKKGDARVPAGVILGGEWQ